MHEITVGPRTPGQPWAIKAVIRNYGQTPALNVVTYAMFGLSTLEYLNKRPPPEEVEHEGGPLGPENELYVERSIPPELWEPAQAGLDEGHAVLGAVGVIKYNDVFGAPHETHYRMYLPFQASEGLMGHSVTGNAMT